MIEDKIKYNDYWERVQEQDKEIERLKTENKELGRDYSRANNEFLRLHSIIKEVREYIKENTSSYYTNIEETNEEFELICDPEELLEILDKEMI